MNVTLAQLTQFFLLGLSTGGIYVFLALGVVLVYRGSGVVNFAAGGFGFISAAIYYQLHDVHGWPFAVALVIAVGASALLGAFMHLAVMKRMRKASNLARIMTTLGLLVIIQGVDQQRKNSAFAEPVKTFLPTSQVSVLGAKVQVGRVLVFAIAVVLVLVLWLIYRYTRFGLATTAVAENPRISAALGWSPDLVATINWAAGGALSGLAGVMIVPFIGLSGPGMLLLVVPALAVALIGNFSSFSLVLVGGAIIGVLGSEGLLFEGIGTIPAGWSTAVPLVVIIIVLTLRGKGLPVRGEESDKLPRAASGKIHPMALVAIVLLAFSANWFSLNWIASMTTFAGIGLLSLSLVVVTGYCGQISLAQVAFAGLGTLISGRLAAAAGVPTILAIIIGILATMVIGVVVAFPALRVRGVTLAIVTLSMAVVVNSAILSNPDYTGGPFKGTVIDKPEIAGYSIYSVAHPSRYAIVGLIVLAIAGIVVSNIRRGRSGRRLLAVRSNERAAASLGVSVVGAKLYAFGIGAGLAATGGIYTSFQNLKLDFNQFTPFQSISLLLYGVIGGIGSIAGAAIAAATAAGSFVEQILSSFFDIAGWFSVASGVVLIIVIITHPDGIADVVTRQWKAASRRMGMIRLRPVVEATARFEKTKSAVEREGIRKVSPQSLGVRNVTVRFGGVVAVDDVSFDVVPGEVVGLIGPNGAGKTTIIDVITGLVKPQAGEIVLNGRVVSGLGVVSRARAGIARSFQTLELFEDLTVEENLRVASEPHGMASYALDLVKPTTPALSPTATSAVAEFELEDVLGRLPGELSYAQRRLVAIARAVAVSPSVLLLDEPAAGLDDASTDELSHLIRRLAADWGMAILLVEHHMGLVMKTCDRIVALNFGRVVTCDTPDKVRVHPGVVDSYLGSTVDDDAFESARVATP